MPEGEGATLLKEFIPQDLQNKEYNKAWLEKPWNKETAAEVFKKLDGAESLLGKRSMVPAKDAPEADWDKFLATMRPEKADDYEIPLPDGTKLDERGQAYTKALKEAMLEAGIPKQAAKKFIAKMQAFGGQDQKDIAAKMEAAKKKATADFEAAATTALGEKRTVAMERTKAALAKYAPAAFKPQLEKLSDENLLLLAGVVNGLMEEYVPADKLNPKPGSSNTEGTQDEETTLDAEGKKLQMSDVLKDPFHPDYQKTKDRIKAIFTRIVEIRNEKKKK